MGLDMASQKNKKENQLIKASDVVFTAVIVAAMLAVLFFMMPKTSGKTVQIKQNGQVVRTLLLSEDTTVEINGTYHNVFVIKDGKISIQSTDCPGKQCQKTGEIFYAGQSIVCAPNGVSATIAGGGDVDAIT